MNSRQGCIAGSVFRLYISGVAVLQWFLAFHEERSLNALVGASPEGAFICWFMLFLGVIGLLDVALNDTTQAIKARPLFEHARTYRHFSFAALAFCHTCLVFLAVLKIASIGLAIHDLWNAVFVIGFSLLDAHQRSIDATKEAVCRPPLFN